MSLPLVVLTGLNFVFSVAGLPLPSGGSGGSRGGSSGGSRGGSSGGSGGGSSGGSKSSSGSGWTSSRNNGRNSGPLSKGGKIALAVIGGIILVIIIGVFIHQFLQKRKEQRSTIPEKTVSSDSSRSSIDPRADMSHNPGHTQAAVHRTTHRTTASEFTSAVMAGEGSRAGHGQEGAGDGSRGGVGAVVWEARALAAVSKGMSDGDRPHAVHGETIAHSPATISMPVPHTN